MIDARIIEHAPRYRDQRARALIHVADGHTETRQRYIARKDVAAVIVVEGGAGDGAPVCVRDVGVDEEEARAGVGNGGARAGPPRRVPGEGKRGGRELPEAVGGVDGHGGQPRRGDE